MGSSLNEINRSNIHNAATDGRGGIDGKCLVLMYSKSVEFPFVDSPLINRTSNRSIDQFTKRKERGKESRAIKCTCLYIYSLFLSLSLSLSLSLL